MRCTTPRASLWWLPLTFAWASCGGAPPAVDDDAPEPGDTATSGDQDDPGDRGVAGAALAAAAGNPYAPRPELNVYVQGPDPAPGERYQATVPDDYRAEIVVTNRGEAPVELSFAMIDFQLLAAGEVISCGDESRTDAAPGPRTLEAGEAHTYEASFHCTIDEAGTYEIRAYMNFGAEISPGEDRERYYVGSREVVVQ